MNTDARRLLDRLPALRKSACVNAFLAVVRDGCGDPATIARRVRDDCARRPGDPRAAELLAALESDPDAALDLAGWAVAWEGLPADERLRQKARRSTEYRWRWMAAQPATEKQERYLHCLGHRGPVLDRASASRLIDDLTRRDRR